MATAAQIKANRRNAQKSTGPKTGGGEEKARLIALNHGRRAKTVAPVLPGEAPAELEDRIRQWFEDMRPGGAHERELVEQAAKTSFDLDCLERSEADERSRRVQEARTKVDDETAKNIRDLGHKLLAMAEERKMATSEPPRDDDPEAFLRGLERSAEGCRWLLDRWTELKNLFERGATWTYADLYRFVRLQGKHPLSAIDDPDLNRQFLAWEVLWENFAASFWRRCHELAPPGDLGFSEFMEWREIAVKPASKEEALTVVIRVVTGRIARLEKKIALYEDIAGEEATERKGAASFDPGPEAEAVRKQRSTLTRELRQLIELILRMQAAREKQAAREADREGEAGLTKGPTRHPRLTLPRFRASIAPEQLRPRSRTPEPIGIDARFADRQPTAVVEIPRFKSRPGALAWSFRKSRDRRKARAMKLRAQLKRSTDRVADVTKSRERWKTRAEATHEQLAARDAEVAAARERDAALEVGKKSTRPPRP
jgi:hypothetical protein